MTMLTLNAAPFTTGQATYRDFDPENRSRKPGFYVQVAFPGSSGGSLYALIDTGTPYCIFNTAVVEILGLPVDEGEKMTLRTAYGPFEGTVQRLTIRLSAERGASLDIDASVFIAQDWHLGNFLGYTGFLERFRFAVDPGGNAFYFGPCAS